MIGNAIITEWDETFLVGIVIFIEFLWILQLVVCRGESGRSCRGGGRSPRG